MLAVTAVLLLALGGVKLFQRPIGTLLLERAVAERVGRDITAGLPDGLHIALASVVEADLLVSWNFRHIVHFDKIRLFNSVNLEQSYKPLQIYSPREVARIEGD